jgi:hypothetical protein
VYEPPPDRLPDPGRIFRSEETKEDSMSRLIRLDRTGHTELASWTATDADAQEAAIEAFRRELDEGMLASATLADGSAEVVRELPLDADLVVLRRPIAGG